MFVTGIRRRMAFCRSIFIGRKIFCHFVIVRLGWNSHVKTVISALVIRRLFLSDVCLSSFFFYRCFIAVAFRHLSGIGLFSRVFEVELCTTSIFCIINLKASLCILFFTGFMFQRDRSILHLSEVNRIFTSFVRIMIPFMYPSAIFFPFTRKLFIY